MTRVCISLLLFFALLLSQCAAAASAEDVLLMHRWSFNENLYDSVGGVSKTAAIGGGATLYQNTAKFKCGDYDTNVMNEGYVLLPPNVTEGISNSSRERPLAANSSGCRLAFLCDAEKMPL